MSKDSFIFKKKTTILDTDMESVRESAATQSSGRSAKQEWLDSQSLIGDEIGIPFTSLVGDDIGIV